MQPLCPAECARRPDRAELTRLLTANIEESAGLVDDGVAFTRAARECHDLLAAFTPRRWCSSGSTTAS